jgi:uncharacterized membrane protein
VDLILARALHVISVVAWIGGVGFVTTALLPGIRRRHPPQARLGAFVQFESRFAPQARIWVAVAGLSGLYLVMRLQLWPRFASAHFWWMHAMVALWLVFAAMLFLLEPLVLHARMQAAVDTPDGARLFERMARLHQVLFGAALITVFGAVAGSHGL